MNKVNQLAKEVLGRIHNVESYDLDKEPLETIGQLNTQGGIIGTNFLKPIYCLS